MNYKELFRRLFALIATPKKAWIEISCESPRRDVMGTFVYPSIALCGLAVLLSAFIHDGLARNVYQPALMEMCSCCISLFGGFFFAAWLLDMLRQRLLGHASDMPGSQLFVGYTMGTVFLANILAGIFPQYFIFWWMLRIYVFYVAWEGCDVLFAIAEEKRLTFAALASVAVVLSPVIIRTLFNTLSNTLG